MENRKYKVEVYITPQLNKLNLNGTNEIDDVKVAKLKCDHVNSRESEDNILENNAENDSVQNSLESNEFCNTNGLTYSNSDRSFATESFQNELNTVLDDNTLKTNIDGTTKNEVHISELIDSLTNYSISPLMQNNMVNKVNRNVNNVCYHGHQYGCTADRRSPEEISQEIFKENWLQKLEALQRRELLIKDQEVALKNKDIYLAEKEKKLIELEESVNEKLKRAEKYLNEIETFRISQQSQLNCINEDTNENQSLNKKYNEQFSNNLENETNNKEVTEIFIDAISNCSSTLSANSSNKSSKSKNSQSEIIKVEEQKPFTDSFASKKNTDEKFLKNPPNSKSSLFSIIESQNNKSHTYASMRYKQRRKISYDDLDSTLSADIGDSSFVVTSQKFDPKLFKKPHAFRRTVSERRGKCNSEREQPNQMFSNLNVVKEENSGDIEINKVLRYVSDNISVSQDKDTKLQYYGLIDQNIGSTENLQNQCHGKAIDDRKYSYLDLDSGHKYLKGKSLQSGKIRPTSWNEETNEWLQKKRQAYNKTMKHIPIGEINKENEHSKLNMPDKSIKKKNKSKLFTIFR